MEKKYFSCTLKTDIVLNASLATEGNMQTLNYISGSNFWGIVASQLYPELIKKADYQTILDLFHNGAVKFGDARISVKGDLGYPMPFSLFKDKLAKDLFSTEVYAHYVLDQKNIKPTDGDEKNLSNIQLKQHRSGFMTPNHKYIKGVEKRFVLKSAHSREHRKSKDGAMFGFESLRANQTFIFSITFSNINYENMITDALVGGRRIGKSKSAQYGQVDIQPIDTPKVFENKIITANLLLVYAASNICLLDQYGHPTFQPDAKRDFEIDGEIIWSSSQIRTYAYSPWNAFRNTTEPERHCILAGSVIAIKVTDSAAINVDNLPSTIGQWTAEGLGEVLYNPSFLTEVDNETGHWLIKLKEVQSTIEIPTSVTENVLEKAASSSLSDYLQAKNLLAQQELKTGKAVQKFINDHAKAFADISNSQWGFIRATALNIKYSKVTASEKENKEEKEIQILKETFFGTTNKDFINKKKDNNGILVKGVAAQKYWDKNFGKRRTILWESIDKNQIFALNFVTKLATEMTKRSKK